MDRFDAGLTSPGPPRVTDRAIRQRCRWTVRFAGWMVLAGGVLMVGGFLVFVWSARSRSELLRDIGLLVCVFGLMVVLVSLQQFSSKAGHWCLDAGRGQGELRLGVWPFHRRITFPLDLVRRVSLLSEDTPISGRSVHRLGLVLDAGGGHAEKVTLATYADERRATVAANGVAEWLDTKISDRVIPEPMFDAKVKVSKTDVALVQARRVGLPGVLEPVVPTARLRFTRGGNRLIITPDRAFLVLLVTCFLLGLTAIVAGAYVLQPGEYQDRSVGVFTLALGAVPLGFGVLGCLHPFRFVMDKRTGLLLLRVGLTQPRVRVSLGAIAAIQAVYVGWGRFGRDAVTRGFEVNVALADGVRYNLCRTAGADRAREVAGAIARFIGVPVIDQMGGF